MGLTLNVSPRTLSTHFGGLKTKTTKMISQSPSDRNMDLKGEHVFSSKDVLDKCDMQA